MFYWIAVDLLLHIGPWQTMVALQKSSFKGRHQFEHLLRFLETKQKLAGLSKLLFNLQRLYMDKM